MSEFVEPSDHYSGSALHRKGLPSGERVRLEAIRAEIPDGARRILDCGCGVGNVGNFLGKDYEVVGCDVASAALSLCEFPTAASSLTSLAFVDRSFDLVLSSEVLEHIVPQKLEVACRELERVADRWLLVTVPYREDLESSRVQCPHCGTIFHDAWHLRSVSQESITDWFEAFVPVRFFRMGHKQRLDQIWKRRLRHRLSGYRRLGKDRQCPLCGCFGTASGARDAQLIADSGRTGASLPLRRPGLYGALRAFGLRIVPGRPRWLGCLLERR